MAHYTFRRELSANSFYQRNGVDLKPVSIIRFTLQFGFRIDWDSDPSGFGILKCPALGNTIHDTPLCDAITKVFDEIVLKIVINTITKTNEKRLTVSQNHKLLILFKCFIQLF